jgi:hypothetical protein
VGAGAAPAASDYATVFLAAGACFALALAMLAWLVPSAVDRAPEAR